MSILEGFIQTAPDSSGKKVRNVQLTVLQADGTLATVYMQVVAIVDDKGNIIDRFADEEFQSRVIELLTQIRDGLALMINQPLGS